MKFLKTVGINLLQFARSRTLVCVLILLGLTIAGFCLNVYYAQAMADITSLKASHHADRDLKFVFTQDVSSKQALAGLQNKNGRMIADFWICGFSMNTAITCPPRAWTIPARPAKRMDMVWLAC
ncbi:MAG: hypothetical protein ACLSAP_00580 [Oscillospiraceae bacterium]